MPAFLTRKTILFFSQAGKLLLPGSVRLMFLGFFFFLFPYRSSRRPFRPGSDHTRSSFHLYRRALHLSALRRYVGPAGLLISLCLFRPGRDFGYTRTVMTGWEDFPGSRAPPVWRLGRISGILFLPASPLVEGPPERSIVVDAFPTRFTVFIPPHARGILSLQWTLLSRRISIPLAQGFFLVIESPRSNSCPPAPWEECRGFFLSSSIIPLALFTLFQVAAMRNEFLIKTPSLVFWWQSPSLRRDPYPGKITPSHQFSPCTPRKEGEFPALDRPRSFFSSPPGRGIRSEAEGPPPVFFFLVSNPQVLDPFLRPGASSSSLHFRFPRQVSKVSLSL